MSQRLVNFIEKYRDSLPSGAADELLNIHRDMSYFEKTFNNSPCTISLISQDGEYLNANKKMLSMLNITLDELKGRKVGDITKDGSIAALLEEVKSEGLDEKHVLLEPSFKDGSKKQFWLTINKVAENFLVIGSDVTDFKNLEQEKMFSDKMAFLGEMSSFIVHEINNPLMSISMANEIIQMNAKDNNTIQHTQNIEEMITTIAKIIESLKVFSRRDTNQVDQVNLDRLFEQSQMILSGKIKHSGVKVFCGNLKDVVLPGNEVEFLQILVNLISNSIDAAKNTAERWVKVEWSNDRLKIIDSGNGVPEHVIPNLFKKFYTSKGNKGNGIGLYLSRELLNKSGLDLIYQLDNGHTSFQWIKKPSLPVS